jgi:hypothetical protein
MSSEIAMQANILTLFCHAEISRQDKLLPFHCSTYITLQPALPHRPIANLSLSLIPQNLPQNLPRRVLGDGVHELDAARQPLVLSHLVRQPRGNVLLRGGAALAVFLQRDVSARQLFAVDGDAHDGGVLHGRVLEEEGFELGGRDLVAFDFDEFLRRWTR